MTSTPGSVDSSAVLNTRLCAIDALRGFVMLCMVVDHVRETFFMHRQVGDPVDALTVAPDLFFTRLLATLCAPVFIFLTGLSAFLYGQKHSARDTSIFLLKRGVFLVLLELTLVCFAWNAEFPPKTLWLQVIWCIGICMIVLAGLLHLRRAWLVLLGLLIVGGHNLLDGVVLGPESLLPWIGVILLGWSLGPWFASGVEPAVRRVRLLKLGAGLLLAFVLIRYLNVYGDAPWVQTGDTLRTVMSFLSAKKYPPSLMFLLPTLGVGLLLLAAFEKLQERKAIAILAIYGGAPMFFYLLHLYVLKAMYLSAFTLWGATEGSVYAFSHLSSLWLLSLLLCFGLFFPTRWFARLKQRRRDIAWLKYF